MPRLRSLPSSPLCVLALALSAWAGESSLAEEGELAWEHDWKRAREVAEREMRPILLDFTADWCVPCRLMDEQFWPHPEVRPQTSRFVRVRVEFDDELRLREQFRVGSIPNVIVLDPWANVLGRLTGWAGDPERHLALLRAVPEDFGPIAEEAKAASLGKASGSAYERLGELYFPTFLAGASRQFLKEAVGSRELRADPNRRGLALAKIGWCELRLDNAIAARRSFEKALKTADVRTDLAVGGLAVAWAHLDKPERASALLQELRSEHPTSQMVSVVTGLLEKGGMQEDP